MGSRFVGRAGEVQRLRDLLTHERLVTVTGPGGIGKTRLVVETVRDLDRAHPGGIVRGELSSLPPDAGVDAIGSQLGFASPEAAAARLGPAPALLVLDNCEHVLDAVTRFVARLRPGAEALRVVTTSREPLGLPDERLLVVPPLPVPTGEVDIAASPAVQLFLDRAEAGDAAWDRSPATLSAVGELCRQLDGLPLAIELAAGRARALGPADLLGHMTRRLDLLRHPGRPRAGEPARHRSLRASLDVSVDLLADEERRAFRCLGTFAGPFDLDLAHGVVAPPGGDRLHTLDLLTRLVDCSLVAARPPDPRHGSSTTYQLLSLLREHAREGLEASGDHDTVAERFVDAMVDEADRLVVMAMHQWSRELMARIEARFYDMAAALDHCLDHDPDPARAVRLVLPLYPAIHQGRAGQVLEAGRRILERWPDPGRPVPWRAEAIAVAANAAVFAGNRAAAAELGDLALRDPGASPGTAMLAHRALGLAARHAGRSGSAEAAAHFGDGRRAAAAFAAGSFGRELGGFEAAALDVGGDPGAARRLADALVDEATRTGDRLNQTWARLVRAVIAIHAGRWDEVQRDLDQARAVGEALDYRWWDGAIHRLQAVVVAHDPAHGDGPARWAASAGEWRRAVEAAAAQASAGDLALTLGVAAVVAARTAGEPTAAALLAAVPDQSEATPLLEVFPAELERLVGRHPPPAPAPDIVTALRQARSLLAPTAADPPSAPADGTTTDHDTAAGPAGSPGAVLHRHGDHWVVGFAGRRITVGHRKGMDDLAALLREPEREVHCLELMGAADVDGAVGPAVDAQARRAYRERITELQEELAEAERNADVGRAARLEAELDALTAQLVEAFGLGGRSRPTGSSTERARTAVTRRLRATVRHLGQLDPGLGRHLDNALRTGTWCAYRPEVPVRWDVSPTAT